MVEIFVEMRSKAPKTQATYVSIVLGLKFLVGIYNHIAWFQQNMYTYLAWLLDHHGLCSLISCLSLHLWMLMPLSTTQNPVTCKIQHGHTFVQARSYMAWKD